MVHRLQLQLGAPPVTALAVVADGVAGPHTDPLGHRSVLLQLLAELLLDAEGLQGRHFKNDLPLPTPFVPSQAQPQVRISLCLALCASDPLSRFHRGIS